MKIRPGAAWIFLAGAVSIFTLYSAGELRITASHVVFQVPPSTERARQRSLLWPLNNRFSNDLVAAEVRKQPPFVAAPPHWDVRSCQLDTEGTWSIGLFRGPSPLNLTPFQGALPPGPLAANPIITCASVIDAPSNFVADPFLWIQNGTWYIFFETKTQASMQGDIGVAQSLDEGRTWQYVGIALNESWHLSYPFLFKWEGEVYMLPEAAGSGRVQAYKATKFPLQWKPDAVLFNRMMADVTLVNWDSRWWSFSSPHENNTKILDIHYADSPLGPWTPHRKNPVFIALDNVDARMAGGLVVHNGTLLRFAQDDSFSYGHAVHAYQVERLTTEEYQERRVQLHIQMTAPGTLAWNGIRHHHLDAHEMPDGTWVAAMDGDNRR